MKYIGQEGDIKENIYILGIETSCDDTCASVVKDGRFILSNVVSSQENIHKKYGGIVPEVASRRHIEIIDIVIKEAIESSGVSLDRISAVAVTNRPGLIGSLLVGVGAAKAICYARKIPLIAVNHLKAHIFSNILANPDILADLDMNNIDTRFVALVVSGGHSSLYLMDSNRDIKTIGYTLDDAAGEAFDKIARYLNLGYPGGPIIDRLSKKGNPHSVDFPRPMIESGDFNFSFSGLKTALIYKTKKERKLLREENIPDLVASFQKALVDVLVEKTLKACKTYDVDKVLISGGVAANSMLREEFENKAKKSGISVFIPPLYLCMDNAAMVSCLGYYEYIKGNLSSLDIDVYSRSDF